MPASHAREICPPHHHQQEEEKEEGVSRACCAWPRPISAWTDAFTNPTKGGGGQGPS